VTKQLNRHYTSPRALPTILKSAIQIMTLIDRIAYISFWINIFFVIFMFIGMPLIFIHIPGSTDSWTSNKGLNPLNMTLSILNLFAAFHWGYCIWFLFKYDRYSKSIFPLFFFNVIYAPVYYYRVKIKKRPLRNKINKPIEVATEDKSIDDTEFIKLTREGLIGVIRLWTSKEEQLEYQKSDPIAQVSSELFEQWEDFYSTDSEVLTDAFNHKELKLLDKFDFELTTVRLKLNNDFPQINDFVKTAEWNTLNLLAIDIFSDLK
jgi:hypothetical protein